MPKKKAAAVLVDYLNTQFDRIAAADAGLRRVAVAAGTTPGENGFTYGMLYAREKQIAAQCRKALSGI